MRLGILMLLTIFVAADTHRATADETFEWVGPQWTSNSNPAVFGNDPTALVTLSCSGPCADGTYYYFDTGGPYPISNVVLTAGSFSLSLNTPGVIVEGVDLNVTNGMITGGFLSLYIPANPANGEGQGAVAALNLDGTFNIASENGVGGANTLGTTYSGTWSLVGAPGPMVGTGILPTLLGIGGFIFWRRRIAIKAIGTGTKLQADL
jgi:hypothetical protein